MHEEIVLNHTHNVDVWEIYKALRSEGFKGNRCKFEKVVRAHELIAMFGA